MNHPPHQSLHQDPLEEEEGDHVHEVHPVPMHRPSTNPIDSEWHAFSLYGTII